MFPSRICGARVWDILRIRGEATNRNEEVQEYKEDCVEIGKYHHSEAFCCQLEVIKTAGAGFFMHLVIYYAVTPCACIHLGNTHETTNS